MRVDEKTFRKAFIILSMGRLVDAFLNGLMITLIPYTLIPLQGWGTRELQIGIIFSSGSLLGTLVQPIVGKLADIGGSMKRWVVGGMLLAAVGSWLFIFKHTTSYYIMFRVIQGLGIGVGVPTALALVAVLSPQANVGKTVGGYVTFRMLGFLIGPVAGAWFFEHGMPNAGFLFGGGVALLAGILISSYVPDERTAPQPSTQKVHEKIPPLALFLGLCQFIIATSVSVFAPLAKRFGDEMHVTPMMFGLAFSAFLVTRLLFQYPAGWLSDRVNPRILVLIGLFSTGITLGTFTLARNGMELIIGRALQGMSTSFITTPALAWMAKTAPQYRLNESLSYLTSGFGLGIVAGPLLSGFLSSMGPWTTAYYAVSILSFIMAGFLSFMSFSQTSNET